jgi:hypothetical protein
MKRKRHGITRFEARCQASILDDLACVNAEVVAGFKRNVRLWADNTQLVDEYERNSATLTARAVEIRNWLDDREES